MKVIIQRDNITLTFEFQESTEKDLQFIKGLIEELSKAPYAGTVTINPVPMAPYIPINPLPTLPSMPYQDSYPFWIKPTDHSCVGIDCPHCPRITYTGTINVK